MTTETARTANLQLLGDEMLAWSDQTDDGASVRADVLVPVVARLVARGSQVLVAGPHERALIAPVLANGGQLTCLVRGRADAAALAGKDVRVLVGSLARLPAGLSFDVVVAGAGLSVLNSVEGEPLDWDSALSHLVARLRPGGALVLAVENPMGLHRLVDASPWYALRGNTAWTISGLSGQDGPANLAQLHLRLGAAGLSASATYAMYPSPTRSTALVATSALEQCPPEGFLDAVVHEACAGVPDGMVVLRDPGRLAVDALRVGLGASLAPGWLVVAQRPSDTATKVDLPAAIVRNGESGPHFAALTELFAGPGSWRRNVVEPVLVGQGSRGSAVRRRFDRLAGPVVGGPLLLTLLLDASVARESDRVRTLLTGYAKWLATKADARRNLGDEYALATPDNMICADGNYAVLDPSWQSTRQVALTTVLARGLWLLAVELATGGYAHPWPSTLDITGLTVVLGGLAGLDLDRAVVAEAIEMQATVLASVRELDPKARAGLAAQLHAIVPTAPPAGMTSVQQMREAMLRQSEELTRLRALLTWNQELLESRERTLRHLEFRVKMMSGSITYRVGRVVLMPLRPARRLAGRVLRKMRSVRADVSNRDVAQ